MKIKGAIVTITLIGILLVILGSIPYSAVTVPEWKVKVVNREQEPVKDCPVTQIWWHSTYKDANSSHEETRHTDVSGTVTFPERRIEVSSLSRGWGVVKETIDVLPHTSYGPHSYIFIPGSPKGLTYKGGTPTENIIVGPNCIDSR